MNPALEALFEQKESIRSQISELEKNEEILENLEELTDLDGKYEEVIDEISKICATKNKELVEEYLGKNNDTLEGFNQVKTWALKKKLAPKTAADPPAAKLNSKGKLVTNKEELEQLYLDTYIERLKPNPVDEDLEDIFELKNELFDMRIEESKTKVTSDWTMDDLEEVLKTLKSNKA